MPIVRERNAREERKGRGVNFWTATFCEVCHVARLYAEAVKISRETTADARTGSPYLRDGARYYQKEAAKYKARLEAACATYRVIRENQLKGVL